ncbi:hypothetical protein HA402_010179 [Bradysia odoriphaga]|nr:hypothetical protein HA402_010179 [Bradysia odoriphaga]
MVPELKLDAGAAVRFLFPNAPGRAITINNGMVMRAWYDIMSTDLVRKEDDAGIRQSEAAIRALIANENARGIPTSRIVLTGFSQGCAMVLHIGLRLPEKLAGIIGLSGYLPLLESCAKERLSANDKTPIFMAHGMYDPVVDLSRAEASHLHLQQLGYDVRWHIYPMPHSVCADEVMDISAYLREVIA